jgi:hypothetical protein
MNRVFIRVQIFGEFASLILIEVDLENQARQLVDSYRGAGEQIDDVTLLLMEFEFLGRSDIVPSTRVHEVVRKAVHRNNA